MKMSHGSPRPHSTTKRCLCHPLDCEVKQTSAAAGGRKQRALQAWDVPLFCYCCILAYKYLDLVAPLKWTESPKTLDAEAISSLKAHPFRYTLQNTGYPATTLPTFIVAVSQVWCFRLWKWIQYHRWCFHISVDFEAIRKKKAKECLCMM